MLIDDLVTKGTEEPYRMFTSRAEYRILLRQDNADIRLTPIAYQRGLVGEDRFKRTEQKISGTKELVNFYRKQSVNPTEMNTVLDRLQSAPISQKMKAFGILARPKLVSSHLSEASVEIKNRHEELGSLKGEVVEQAEILVKYDGYIAKERENADKLQRLDNIKLHKDFDYEALKSLSSEAKEKLSKIRPSTVAQAARISGVTPADLSVIMVYLGR